MEILHSGAFISSFVFIQLDNAVLLTTLGRKLLNYLAQLSNENTSYPFKMFLYGLIFSVTDTVEPK